MIRLQSDSLCVRVSASPPAWTHLSRDVGLGAGVGVEPGDGQLGVGERGAAAPQLLLGARVQLETVLQHGQFLDGQERQTELLEIK